MKGHFLAPSTNSFSFSEDKSEGGLNEREFHDVLDKVLAVYQPIFSNQNLQLKVNRDWDNSKVNAYASVDEDEPEVRKLSFNGGMARHSSMTIEAFTIIVCHEIGHHLGGAPKSPKNPYISVEGEADYFATLKCLRNVYASEDNFDFLENALKQTEIPETVGEKCRESFTDAQDIAICMRSALAGQDAARFISTAKKDEMPQFHTPSIEEVEETSASHPKVQCRLDTFFQGALCHSDAGIQLADNDPSRGACTRRQGDLLGIRPTCWYNPDSSSSRGNEVESRSTLLHTAY